MLAQEAFGPGGAGVGGSRAAAPVICRFNNHFRTCNDRRWLVTTRFNRDWVGRRWFEMRIGYGTYLAFTFGFANFIMLLHGLTDWFNDYPLHWFGITMFLVIVPVSILVGHRHNRTQQKTEAKNLAHLHPFIDKLVPDSKDILFTMFDIRMLDYMHANTRDEDMRVRIAKFKLAFERHRNGEPATKVMRDVGIP